MQEDIFIVHCSPQTHKPNALSTPPGAHITHHNPGPFAANTNVSATEVTSLLMVYKGK